MTDDAAGHPAQLRTASYLPASFWVLSEGEVSVVQACEVCWERWGGRVQGWSSQAQGWRAVAQEAGRAVGLNMAGVGEGPSWGL